MDDYLEIAKELITAVQEERLVLVKGETLNGEVFFFLGSDKEPFTPLAKLIKPEVLH